VGEKGGGEGETGSHCSSRQTTQKKERVGEEKVMHGGGNVKKVHLARPDK